MTKYDLTITEVVIHPEMDNPVFGEGATKISIDDEAGGPFLKITQETDSLGTNEIRLDFNEIEFLFKAIEILKKSAEYEQRQSKPSPII